MNPLTAKRIAAESQVLICRIIGQLVWAHFDLSGLRVYQGVRRFVVDSALPMFCPRCRAEYRPGFSRCSDCDVDLVQEPSELGSRASKSKRYWSSMRPTVIGGLYKESRSTFRWWTRYKRQTGTWPWSSIAIHSMNWGVIFLGGGLLLRWSAEHHLSKWQFLGVLLLVAAPYLVFENWAKRIVKLNHLRNRKRIQLDVGQCGDNSRHKKELEC